MNENCIQYVFSRTKTLSFLSACIFIGLLASLLFYGDAKADTITVDDDGDADYTSIQFAIENASIGDTIFVRIGRYSEHIVINKTVNLLGENPKRTHLYGRYINSTILIRADHVNISRLHIGGNHIGINLSHSNHCNISNNYITESYPYFGNSSGLMLQNSHHSVIYNNTFYGNANSAIALIESNQTRIIKNLFSWNLEAIFLDNSSNITLNNNTFYETWNFVINSTTDEEVNAQNNYWFTEGCTNISTLVNTDVNFENWLDHDPTYNQPPNLVEGMPYNLSINEGEYNESFLDLNDYFDDEFYFLEYDVVYNSEPSHVEFPINLWHILRIDASYGKWHGIVEVIINATDILGYNTSLILFITVNDVYEPPEIEYLTVSSRRWGIEEKYLWKPYHMHEGDKLIFIINAYDDNLITKIEAKVDEGEWKVIYENASDWNLGESIKCYYNWTVPRGGGGNHTFSFRAYDGVEYSNVSVRDIYITYLGDKATIEDVISLLLLIVGIAVTILAIILVLAYVLGRRGQKKYQ